MHKITFYTNFKDTFTYIFNNNLYIRISKFFVGTFIFISINIVISYAPYIFSLYI